MFEQPGLSTPTRRESKGAGALVTGKRGLEREGKSCQLDSGQGETTGATSGTAMKSALLAKASGSSSAAGGGPTAAGLPAFQGPILGCRAAGGGPWGGGAPREGGGAPHRSGRDTTFP